MGAEVLPGVKLLKCDVVDSSPTTAEVERTLCVSGFDLWKMNNTMNCELWRSGIFVYFSAEEKIYFSRPQRVHTSVGTHKTFCSVVIGDARG
jgi:hypothetical protein